MDKKITKRSLLASLLALLLCFSMLIGTTFAWFTDSTANTGNIIKSGTLDLKMSYSTNNTNFKDVEDDDATPIFNYDKWEPGYTEMRYIKLENMGSLAFMWQMHILPDGVVEDLANVIDVYVMEVNDSFVHANLNPASSVDFTKVGTLADMIAENDGAAHGALLSKTSDATPTSYERKGSVTICIAFHMREDAGNEYMDKSIGTTFDITVIATQYTEEVDSFNDQYDAGLTPNVEGYISAIDENGTEYLYSEDGEVLLYDATDFTGDTFIVPDVVTTIGQGSFYGNTNIKEVVIPDSVETIDINAFAYCSNLTTITIEEGVETIGYRAFRDCTSLTTVNLPSTLKTLDGAFHKCASLTSIVIPEGVESIGTGEFYGCTSLTSITLPSTLKTIGDSALRAIPITELTIPASVTYIGSYALRDCNKLTTITIESENLTIASSDWILIITNPVLSKIYVKNETVKNVVLANIPSAQASQISVEILP